MKLLFLSISIFSSVAFAQPSFDGTYTVKNYSWCNGPSSGLTAGCWPFGWKQVDLGKVTEISIESLLGVKFLTIKDSSGQTWTSNVKICADDQDSDCNAQYSAEDNSLKVGFGNSENALSLIIEENELTFAVSYGGSFSLIIVEYIKN